tara:strand:+ start:150 stop:1301 length:1152 start_codon:yes stop_codon:yes gene_type:complete
MKNILVIHTKYRSTGGEDIAVDNETEFLKKSFNIKTLYYSNEIKNYFLQFIYFLINRNFESEKKLNNVIKEFNPDFVYIHNTWFKGSNGIFKFLNKKNIPYAIKIHNFRYDCTRFILSKNHFQSSNYCNLCGLNKSDMGLLNTYFLDSKLKSFFVISYGKKYFKILKDKQTKILVLTKFHKSYLSKVLQKDENIYVFPNITNIAQGIENNKDKKFIVYAGRISDEKGVDILIDTFRKAELENITLRIIGGGPKLSLLKEKFKEPNIEFLGIINNEDTLKLISKSLAVITATKLYEGQPTLLCEASMLGVPSIFPDTGGIKEFFPSDYKLKFEQFDYQDLKSKLLFLNNEKLLNEIGIENKNFLNSMLDETMYVNKFKSIIDDE